VGRQGIEAVFRLRGSMRSNWAVSGPEGLPDQDGAIFVGLVPSILRPPSPGLAQPAIGNLVGEHPCCSRNDPDEPGPSLDNC